MNQSDASVDHRGMRNNSARLPRYSELEGPHRSSAAEFFSTIRNRSFLLCVALLLAIGIFVSLFYVSPRFPAEKMVATVWVTLEESDKFRPVMERLRAPYPDAPSFIPHITVTPSVGTLLSADEGVKADVGGLIEAAVREAREEASVAQAAGTPAPGNAAPKLRFDDVMHFPGVWSQDLILTVDERSCGFLFALHRILKKKLFERFGADVNEKAGFAPPSERAHMSLLYSAASGHPAGDERPAALRETLRTEEGWMLKDEFTVGAVRVFEFGGTFEGVATWQEVWAKRIEDLLSE